MTATVLRQVPLRFRAHAVEAETHVNLSAVRSDGACLWVAGDETATVERLTGADGRYEAHRSVALSTLLDLPGGPDDEVDVEGLGRAGPYLWAVGSHSLKRKKIKDKHGDEKSLDRLGTVVAEPSRRVLARLSVVRDDDGLPELTRHGSALLGEPGLLGVLAGDEHLGPFLGIPGKDNGLDIEGIAVYGSAGTERLYLGLRGPVLRGWAVLVELHPRQTEPGRLGLDPVDGGPPYRLHVADLGGLGIRDLCPDGDDLLILAGPSMDLDGPVRLYRWRGAATVQGPDVVRDHELGRELDLPYGQGCDHAEGIAVLDGRELLIVYDSPAPSRLAEPGTVLADVVSLP